MVRCITKKAEGKQRTRFACQLQCVSFIRLRPPLPPSLSLVKSLRDSYIKKVKTNAKALAAGLRARGHEVATDGTDNHLLLWDLRPRGLTGSKMEKLLEACSISANKV